MIAFSKRLTAGTPRSYNLMPCLGSAAIKKLLQIYRVAPVDQAILMHALDSGFNDFEDAVLYAAAIQAGAEAIITRNTKAFRLAEIPIFTPEEFMVKKVAMVETLKR